MTAQTPPTAPAARERRPDSADLVPSLAASTSSALTASGEGRSAVEVGIEGAICWLLIFYCAWGRFVFLFKSSMRGVGKGDVLVGFRSTGSCSKVIFKGTCCNGQREWQRAFSS